LELIGDKTLAVEVYVYIYVLVLFFDLYTEFGWYSPASKSIADHLACPNQELAHRIR